MKKYIRSAFILIMTAFIILVNSQLHAYAADGPQAADNWRAVRAELEKARIAITNEQELSAIAKAGALLKHQERRLFAEDAATIPEEIKKLEFAVLQGAPKSARAADYDSLFLQLASLINDAQASPKLSDSYGSNEGKSGGDGEGSEIFLINAAERSFSKIFEAGGENAANDDKLFQDHSGKGAFISHISDAIAVNRARRNYYSKITNGDSASVSGKLIAMERATLPIAWMIDRMAHKFNKAGINIIADDFVPMSLIPAQEDPPAFTGTASPEVVNELRANIASFKQVVKTSLKSDDFSSIGAAAYRSLVKIEGLETSGRCHFAMSKHIVESIGFFVLHAVRYAEASNGKTKRLSKLFIRVQVLALPFCHNIDADAQKCHKLGAGVLVNDLPAIPFKAEWESRGAK